MFCIKCGVELADSEKMCPLCGTVVYHPELTQNQGATPYPPYQKPHSQINGRGVLFLITMFYGMLAAILLICEYSIFNEFSWSLYAIGALLLSYIIVLLPTWFRRPNPVIFVPCDFAAIAAYLLFIDLHIHGGWFLSFAMPTVIGCALIVTAVIALMMSGVLASSMRIESASSTRQKYGSKRCVGLSFFSPCSPSIANWSTGR